MACRPKRLPTRNGSGQTATRTTHLPICFVAEFDRFVKRSGSSLVLASVQQRKRKQVVRFLGGFLISQTVGQSFDDERVFLQLIQAAAGV
jgi:hypothetical protein